MMVVNAVKDALKTEKSETRKKLEALFEQTKLVGFGRYVLRVPLEAKLTFGKTRINGGFDVYEGEGHQLNKLLKEKWEKLKNNGNGTAEIISIHDKDPNFKYFWYYNGYLEKKDNSRDFYGVFNLNGHAFAYEGGGDKNGFDQSFSEQLSLIKELRYREENELPKEPGVVLPFGFVFEHTYKFQEEFGAGIYLPSFPDVRFFVSSNVGAKRERGILERLESQRQKLGLFNYPSMVNIREGKKKVGVWEGEESLTRRNKEGFHEFDWSFVGREKRSVGFPGVLEAGLRTKVKDDLTGAAEVSSIEEDEDVVWLWDQLLGSLSFRVPIPGASLATMSINEREWKYNDISPVTGDWRMIHQSVGADEIQKSVKGKPIASEMVLREFYKIAKPEDVRYELVMGWDEQGNII